MHNFDVEPTVSHLDEWWHRKYGEDERGKLVRRPEEEFEWLSAVGETANLEPDAERKALISAIHLPSPSYWPVIVALSLPIIAYGIIYSYWLSGVGGFLLLASIYGWALEPSVDPDAGHGGGHDHADPEPDPASESPEEMAPSSDAESEPAEVNA
jgi:cytochrome c oxidase subunit 1